ncbi:hypothetical protein Tco_1526883 [Tanacetum coccineum]
MRKGKLTTKGRLTIHPETTMAINNNPSRDRMSPRSTIWGRVKRSHMVNLCPSAPSAIFITMARVLRNATNVTRKWISKKRTKNRSQIDKTEHENGKSVKEKSSQSQKSRKSQSQPREMDLERVSKTEPENLNCQK